MTILQIIAIVCYFAAIVTFLIYIYTKLKKRKYFLSIFNISIYTYAFSLFVIPLFLSDDAYWAALGTTASPMRKYLYMSVAINSFGFVISTVATWYFEFNKVNMGWLRLAQKCTKRINGSVIDFSFVAVCLLWYGLVLCYNHGLPLLNRGRGFYLNTWFSPIYLALNEIIQCCAIYYGMKVIYWRKKYAFFLFSCATVAFQGNRGPLITALLLPLGILIIYSKVRSRNYTKVTFKMIRLCVVLLAFGLALAFVRNSSWASIENMINELFKGNTFSGIRDGAYILKGFYTNWKGKYLLGKTYLAGLISFIPSSMSAFRYKWGYGRFTTLGLFGMENHMGLRGGNVMEAYFNFGMVGVIVFAILQGFFSGSLENVFYKFYMMQEGKSSGKEYFAWGLINSLSSVAVCTAGFYNVYVVLLFLWGIVMVSTALRQIRGAQLYA